MTDKHTPPPWEVYATPNDPDFTHEINGVACVYACNGSSEANANLIAASPELFRLLKEVFSIGDRLVKDVYGLEFVLGARAILDKISND